MAISMTTAVPSLDRLARRELLVVTGKGGVGKTVVSATLGRALAARGRRVLVVEVDPRENLHRMLGLPPSGGAIVAAGPRLWVQNLKPRQVLDEVVREQVRIDLIAERVLRSPVYEQFSAAAPGLKEMAILGHAWRLLQGLSLHAPELDLVVLDAPATGHGVALLSAPQLVADVVARGPFGRMAEDLAVLIADPERCGVAVVTQAEEMPVEEALELAATLVQRIGRPPELLVVNGLYPPGPPAPAAGVGGDDSLASLWRRRRGINERELARLRAGWPGDGAIELPQLPLDGGPELVAALEACLEAGGLAAAAPAEPRLAGAVAEGEPAWS
jgi:Mrp family chromosome partitioning ATPase